MRSGRGNQYGFLGLLPLQFTFVCVICVHLSICLSIYLSIYISLCVYMYIIYIHILFFPFFFVSPSSGKVNTVLLSSELFSHSQSSKPENKQFFTSVPSNLSQLMTYLFLRSVQMFMHHHFTQNLSCMMRGCLPENDGRADGRFFSRDR